MEQLVLDLGMVPRATLQGFVVGANAAAVDWLSRLCTAAPQEMPTYLWGPPGAGKTHLLEAVAGALERHGRVVAWLDAQAGASDGFDGFDERWDAILMDDVHAYDARQQQAAFNGFVNAFATGDGVARTVVAAGALPPADLLLRDDLRTRLAWGQVFELRPLDERERERVLCDAAAARGLALAPEVTRYLLTHFARDLSSQMALLDRLDRYALQNGRGLTVPLLKRMLGDTPSAVAQLG